MMQLCEAAIREEPLKMTQAALAHVRASLQQEPDRWLGLRISVVAGGCMGWRYRIELATTSLPREHVIFCEEIPLFFSPVLAARLQGITLDYRQSGLEEGFSFLAPGAESCGCGQRQTCP